MDLTIAVDLAKSVFEVAVSRAPGEVLERRRLTRTGFAAFVGKSGPCTVIMEACSSSHFWTRQFVAIGHRPILLPPHHVRPYRTNANKTDRADAKALLEAFRNKEIHPVPIKSVEQQAISAIHRLRSGWMATRTACINTLRGLLREFGLVIPVGSQHVVAQVSAWLREENPAIPSAIRTLLSATCDQIVELEAHMRSAEAQLAELVRDMPEVKRLRTIPGVGPRSASALVAIVGDPRRFKSGRHFASFLGLTPRERSSGNFRKLGSISKRGDTYLRMLLIHGARAVLLSARRRKDRHRIHSWVLEVEARRGHNVSAVALANKIARIAWATWSRQQDYRPAVAQDAT